jgi:SPP1 gp7 family putative phage head morphogenesis protein
MTWAFTADPLKYDEAVRALRKRVPMKAAAWEKLTERARQKAFKVAGIAQLDLVTLVHEAIAKAVDKGTTLEDFKADIADKLKAAWAGSVEKPAQRIETIFRTNTQISYSHARVRQMRDPAVRKVRPFFLFDGTHDARQTAICSELNDTLLAQDDPFWDSHTPPLHFNCRSGLRALRKEQATALGVTQSPPDSDPAEGFGLAPTDDGDDGWEPDLTDYPPALAKAYQAKRSP